MPLSSGGAAQDTSMLLARSLTLFRVACGDPLVCCTVLFIWLILCLLYYCCFGCLVDFVFIVLLLFWLFGRFCVDLLILRRSTSAVGTRTGERRGSALVAIAVSARTGDTSNNTTEIVIIRRRRRRRVILTVVILCNSLIFLVIMIITQS